MVRLAAVLRGYGWLFAADLIILLVVAPSPGRAQQRPAVAIDSVRGVPRVVNLATSPDELPQFELEEVWRVGGMDAPPEAQFAGPFLATALDQAGHAWILDHTLAQLTLFDVHGNYLMVVAGSGPGPGELSFPTGLSVGPNGEVWVQEALDGYYKVFDLEGNLVRSMRQEWHSINGRVRSFVVGSRVILNHARGYPTLKFFRTDTLATPIDSFSLRVPDIGPVGGPLRPGTAAFRAAGLVPHMRWTMSTDGSSIWVARADSLGFVQLSVHGDTLRRVEARHRTAEFTAQQRADIRAVEHQMDEPGKFLPILIQAIYGLDGGGFLVQVGGDPQRPGEELDLYSAEGVLEGVVHPSIPVNHRSELSSRGDTVLFVGVGENDVPVLVKAVLARAEQDGTVDLRKVCAAPAHYSDPIEPSEAGGHRIAQALAHVLRGDWNPESTVYPSAGHALRPGFEAARRNCR